LEIGRKFIKFVEIGGKCNMHHYFYGEWTSLVTVGEEKYHNIRNSPLPTNLFDVSGNLPKAVLKQRSK